MKIKNAIIVFVPTFLVVWLYMGIYLDREWRDPYLFIKHRPSFKFVFYSPRGEADYTNVPGKEGYLSPVLEKEEFLLQSKKTLPFGQGQV